MDWRIWALYAVYWNKYYINILLVQALRYSIPKPNITDYKNSEYYIGDGSFIANLQY